MQEAFVMRSLGTSRSRRLTLWCAAIAILTTAAPTLGASLQSRLDRLINESRLKERVSLSVTLLDAETGDDLGTYQPDRRLIPASNMKLLTSGTAATVLGPSFVFETAVVRRGDQIVIRGAGDPALADPDLLRTMKLSVDAFLGIWTDAITKSGPAPREVVVDDRVFDREWVHPTWPTAQLNRAYCAEVAGLNFHRNVVSVFAKPEGGGRAPLISLEPATPWLSIKNLAKSVGKDKRHTAWASRPPNSNDITLHGDVRYASSPVEITIHNNPNHVARLVAERVAAGSGSTVASRAANPDEDLSGGAILHVVRSALPTVLARCNMESENLYAESLLKRIGHEVTRTPGSWNNGAAVIRMHLIERLGPSAGTDAIVADGSGMSRENRVTTRLLAQWLRSLAADNRIAEMFVASLPLAGEEGTLDKRFSAIRLANEVRAKSGYLSGVTSLSGYVTDPATGRRAVFSIIANDKPNSVSLADIRTLEEKIVALVDAWVTEQSTAPRMGG
jgi:D-alanyl-D-alanine carboxypeptidase/D-alanyl-D-alanine-endopeptidase (penicillin-binding protein 4)